MSTIPNYRSPDLTARPSWRERINLRLLTFVGIIALLIGFPAYFYLESAITGGIKNIGNGYKRVDLKAMGDFAFDQNNGTLEDIPQRFRDLDGQKVVLYGEMYQPLTAADGRVGAFELCYSISACCVGTAPQVQHFVHARVLPGKELSYYPNQVKVSGTLHVKLVRDEEANKVSKMYHMDVENIEPG